MNVCRKVTRRSSLCKTSHQGQTFPFQESTSISPSAPESFLEDSVHLDPNYDTSEPPYSHGGRKQVKMAASETNVTTDMSDTSESETGGGGKGSFDLGIQRGEVQRLAGKTFVGINLQYENMRSKVSRGLLKYDKDAF